MSRISIIVNRLKNVEALVNILRPQGHKVEISDNWLSVSGFTQEKPELLIVDSLFGLPTIATIKSNYPHIPVVCFMEERNARLAVELLKVGAFDCLCLPLKASQVVGVINRALGHVVVKHPRDSFWEYFSFIRLKHLIVTILFFAVFFFGLKIFGPVRGIIEKDLPYKNPTSAIYDDRNLWISDWYTQAVYKYEVTKDEIKLAGSYYFSDYGPLSITRDNEYLWSADNDFMLRQHVLYENLKTVRKFELPVSVPAGMVVMQGYLWICDGYEKKVYKYRIEDKLVLVSDHDFAIAVPVGLSWDGNNFWTVDAQKKRIFVYEPKMDRLVVHKVYKLPKEIEEQVSGFCVSGKYIYLVYSGNPAKLVRYPIKGLKEEK